MPGLLPKEADGLLDLERLAKLILRMTIARIIVVKMCVEKNCCKTKNINNPKGSGALHASFS